MLFEGNTRAHEMNLESQNLFAALATKKKKKTKSSKDHDKKKKQPDKAERAAELDRAVFSQPAPTTTNWADEDEFDEFDQDLGPLPESWAQVGEMVACCTSPAIQY